MSGRAEEAPGPPLARILSRAEEIAGRASPARLLAMAVAGLCLFLLMTIPLISLLGPNGITTQADGIVPANRTDPGSIPESAEAKAVSERVMAYLTSRGLGIEDFTTMSYARNPDTGQPIHIWEVALPEGRRAEDLADGLADAIQETASGIEAGEVVFDSKTAQVTISVDGVQTHTILLSDLRAEIVPGEMIFGSSLKDMPPPRHLTEGPPKIAIIIDDVGYRPLIEQELLMLDAPLSFAILPDSPNGREFAQRAHEMGRSVLLHMPLEPLDVGSNRPGPGALFVNMPSDRIEKTVMADLEFLPYVEGVNNHMGSRFTQDGGPVRLMLKVVRDRGLYFVDSLTTGRSVAFRESRSLGIPTARRDVFLDHAPSYEQVIGQIERLGALARKNGFAVGIGHPYEMTLAALRDSLPGLRAKGIAIVPVREVVY